MADPIIKWIPEPQLWDIARNDEKDRDYSEPLDTPLTEQKEKAMNMLYSNSPVSWNEKDAESTGANEIQRKIEENPNSPLIDWFVSSGLLTVEEWEVINEALIQWWDIDNNLWKAEIVDNTKINLVLDSIKYLEKPEAKKECLDNFNNDFWEKINWLKQVVDWSNTWEKELIWKNKELIELIGWNYILLENVDWTKESNDDALDRAMKTSLNQLMDWKSFKRPETFNYTVSKVNNNTLSFQERFESLKTIDKLIDTDQSRSNWKQAKAFSFMKKWKETLQGTIDERFINLKKSIEVAKIENNDSQLKELLIDAENLKEEANSSGDIFIAWDIDILINWIKEWKEQA